MRLWHKNLIPVLPRQQLLGQWRECCAIAKAIAESGTPNHILVNRIMDYDLHQFTTYAMLVCEQMFFRGCCCDWERFAKHARNWATPDNSIIKSREVFPYWHNDRYLRQCLYNLQEKYDCGGISEEEWGMICGVWAKQIGDGLK